MYFLGSLIIMGVQLIAYFAVAAAAPQLLYDPNISLMISALPMYAVAVPLIRLLLRSVPAQPPSRRAMSAGQWIAAAAISFALMYISNLIGLFITDIIGRIKGSSVDNAIVDISLSIHPLAALLFMVILAPIIEEYLFRKWLIDRTAAYGEGVSVLLSGLMFGLFHGNLNQFAYAFALGLFFGFIYVKTGHIRYSILLHMLVNLHGSVLSVQLLGLLDMDVLYAASQNPEQMAAVLSSQLPQLFLLCIYFLAFFGIVIAGIILLIVRRKRFTCEKGDLALLDGRRFSAVLLNAGMILFILYWIIQIIAQLFL